MKACLDVEASRPVRQRAVLERQGASYLLRTSGFADEALRETATEILEPVLSAARLEIEVQNVASQASAETSGAPAHRVLSDASKEYKRWVRARHAARSFLLAMD
jgi:hypothetical protein